MNQSRRTPIRIFEDPREGYNSKEIEAGLWVIFTILATAVVVSGALMGWW